MSIEEEATPDEMPHEGADEEVGPDEVMIGEAFIQQAEPKAVDPANGDSGIVLDDDVENGSPAVKHLRVALERLNM